MLIQVRTVKHSTIYGNDTHWHNRWWVSSPVDLQGSPMQDLGRQIIELERQVHQQHVIYDYALILKGTTPADAAQGKAELAVPFGIHGQGFQQTTESPSTLREALYIRKFAQGGRTGRWFFYGCLDLGDIVPNPHGHAYLKSYRTFTNIVQTWAPELLRLTGCELVVPRYASISASPLVTNHVESLQCGGVSFKNASTRRQSANNSPGVGIWQGIVQRSVEFQHWRDQMLDWLAFNHDFVPTDAQANTITLLGEIKALASNISKFVEGSPNSEGEQGTIPTFRFAPTTDAVDAICTSIKTSVPTDVEQISQKQPYHFVDGFDYFTHDDADDINNRLTKYADWLAEIAPADWLNPQNLSQD